MYKHLRILYNNGNGILDRITTNEIDNKVVEYLNFKEENESEKVLKESKETSALEINDKIKFEIDDYIQPKMQVVAVEGEKDKLIQFIKN